jgi:hypothetical protein
MSLKLNSEIAVLGIDIGENSCQDKAGSIVMRQKWSRSQAGARLAT